MQTFYIDKKVRPTAKIETVVTAAPDDPNILLKSTIAFYIEFFKRCPTLTKVNRSF